MHLYLRGIDDPDEIDTDRVASIRSINWQSSLIVQLPISVSHPPPMNETEFPYIQIYQRTQSPTLSFFASPINL